MIKIEKKKNPHRFGRGFFVYKMRSHNMRTHFYCM